MSGTDQRITELETTVDDLVYRIQQLELDDELDGLAYEVSQNYTELSQRIDAVEDRTTEAEGTIDDLLIDAVAAPREDTNHE